MIKLDPDAIETLRGFLDALIDQEKAKILIPAKKPEPGYWFGGGKLALDQEGTLWLTGRYRNAGDSRTGLEAGVRGVECVLFRSDDEGRSFARVQSWSKADLSTHGEEVISIEGTALHQNENGGWVLYISTEKNTAYPGPIRQYQKPGTGLWSIDRITGPSPDRLEVETLEPVLCNLSEPAYLHVKDPVVLDDEILVFCSHPYTWSSDNSGYATQQKDARTFTVQAWEMAPRGAAWDVAVTRITSRLLLPKWGRFAGLESLAIYFYDGAECMRNHDESTRAHKRPRGYSCEEIGGAFVGGVNAFPRMDRLSALEPCFVSPYGTGASRYVDCVILPTGILATWQQSQVDGSQPLVGHFLPNEVIEEILAA